MFKYLRSKKNYGSIIWAVVILILIFSKDGAQNDLSLLFGTHQKTYPTKVTVENKAGPTTVSYSYRVGESDYDNTQTVFTIFLWLNNFYPTNKQFEIIYKTDAPKTALLLGNLYVDIAFKLMIGLLGWAGIVFAEIFFNKRRKKTESPTPPSAPQDEDFIKHK